MPDVRHMRSSRTSSCVTFRVAPGTGYLVHRLFIVVYSVFSFVISVVVIAHIDMFVLFGLLVCYLRT
jgi:hypothetical protein